MITFLLARIGYGGNSALFGTTVDEIWLGYLTVGVWLIIIPVIIVGIVLEDPMSWKLVSRNKFKDYRGFQYSSAFYYLCTDCLHKISTTGFLFVIFHGILNFHKDFASYA